VQGEAREFTDICFVRERSFLERRPKPFFYIKATHKVLGRTVFLTRSSNNINIQNPYI
jgi:hypothetical protein